MEQGGEGGGDFYTTAITVTGIPEDIVAIGMLFTQDITTQRKIPGCWPFNNSLAMHMYIVLYNVLYICVHNTKGTVGLSSIL